MAAARDPVALKLPAHGHPLQFSQLHCEIAVRLLCVSYLSSAHDLLFQLETATEVVFLKTGRARRPTVFAISAAILLLLIAASTAFWIGRRPRAAPGRSLVAIQRFKNLSADPAQEYFTSGMTEEIRDQLPKISAIGC